jgi:RHS repeat-associated protein
MSASGPEPADRQMNQYTTTPFDAETYDRNGNLIANNAGQPNQRLLSYDYRNRLVGAEVQDTGTLATYAYDALGRRISKHVTGGSPLNFVHSGWRVVEERTNGNTSANYVHGNYIDEVLQMRRSSQSDYYHADDLFSVAALSSATGATEERYCYADYGLPTQPGSRQLVSQAGNTYFFTGREFHAEVGLLDYRTRHLDPKKGRYVTRDEIDLWGDLANVGNAETYVGSNPLRSVDPFGRESFLPRGGPQLTLEIAPPGNQTRNWVTPPDPHSTAARLLGDIDQGPKLWAPPSSFSRQSNKIPQITTGESHVDSIVSEVAETKYPLVTLIVDAVNLKVEVINADQEPDSDTILEEKNKIAVDFILNWALGIRRLFFYEPPISPYEFPSEQPLPTMEEMMRLKQWDAENSCRIR